MSHRLADNDPGGGINLTGRQFGELTVLGLSHRNAQNRKCWRCLCSCGKTTVVAQSNLLYRGVRSCGCCDRFGKTSEGTLAVAPGTRIADLTGRTFGYMTVLSFSHRRDTYNYWHCACACGNIIAMRSDWIIAEQPKSCGCRTLVGDASASILRTDSGKFVHDLRGQRFGKLTVKDYSHADENGLNWVVECDCGTVRTMAAKHFRSGKVYSCGCAVLLASAKKETFRTYNWFVMIKGRRIAMRSGYEVAVALYFQRHHIRFEYEPAVFDLPNHKKYIPDFYLPALKTYIEVKGYMRPSALEKIHQFRDVLGKPLLIISNATIRQYLPDGLTYFKFLRQWRESHR